MTLKNRLRSPHLGVSLLLVALVLAAVFPPQSSHAGGIPDGKALPILPAPDDTGTLVTPDGSRFDITGGQRSQDGANLFHSFTQFILETGYTANFLADPATQNILARVVGGNLSAIDGLIQVTGGSPNLFLINPAGIVFGANASLNIPGSFTATTANGIGFGKEWLNASGPNSYEGLVGTPDLFAFSMSQPAGIINTGNLEVAAGQNLTLLGGTVISTGQLTAPEGHITVAAVPGNSLVRLSQAESLLTLDIQAIAPDTYQPNPWDFPIVDLPDLLTGGLGKNATNITTNRDGQLVLSGSGLTVLPGDVVVQNATARSATLVAAGKVTLGNTPLPLPDKGVHDSIGNPLSIQPDGNTYLVTSPTGSTFYIRGNIEVLIDPGDRVSNPGTGGKISPNPLPDIDIPFPIDKEMGITFPPSIPEVDLPPIPEDPGASLPAIPEVPGDLPLIPSEKPTQQAGPVPPDIPINPEPGSPEGIGTPALGVSPDPLPEPSSGIPPSPQPETGIGATTGVPPSPPPEVPSATPGATPQPKSGTIRQQDIALASDRPRSNPPLGTAVGGQQIAIATITQDCLRVGQIVENQGTTYRVITDQGRVIQCYQQQLALAQQQNQPQQQRQTLHNLGSIYFIVGNYAQSIQRYQQSLAIAQQLQNRAGEAEALSGLGAAYSAVGNYTKAIQYYEKSLAISRTLDAPELQGMTLRNLGIAYLAQDNLAKALEYPQESLAIAQKAQDRRGIGQSLGNLGLVYFTKGDHAKAIEHLEQQLAIARELKDRLAEGRALGNLGLAYYGLENYQQAADYQQQSLAIAQQLQDRPGEGHALNNLGDAWLRLGKLAEAEQALFAGIKVWESLRAQLDQNDDATKISIFETQATTYSTLQEVLIAQNKAQAALEVAERGRARAFVELLAKQLPTQGSKSLAGAANLEPPSIAQIQQIARAQNATLVEYSIIQEAFQVEGQRQIQDKALYIWVVQPNGEVTFRQVDLKPLWQQQKTSLDDLVASTRASIGIEGRGLAFNQTTEAVTSALERLQRYQTQQSQLKQLHQLLIQPIADLLPSDPTARVVFIPQGSLFLAPFPALQDAAGKYLIEKHTMLTAPAIEVLALTYQQRQRQGIAQPSQPTQVAATTLPRSPQQSLIVGNPTMPNLPSENGERSQPLYSLPGSEREAKMIASLLNTEAITGSAATKATVMAKMGDAQIIHLATHGLLDDFRGLGIPGAIALAPSGQDDGLLTANDILGLKLNAELVVLSACGTGRGKITGDGVVGLSRSLISAGAPSVVVSLWQVPDHPTAALMTEFYQNLQRQPDKAQALRQAMLAMLKQHPDPRDWAAFTLIGEAE
ncbi:CHAT domain-containing protein [Trichocoleus sp. FACHB-591]|uniref:CHAT domain-containing protein n=1 Tax=Trichocoleus sp. FACHB-591 TaxID=2692872 RepID=UPI0016879F7A|nr:CHAT domain-containing protein [Trichocoleus sp. FACHB-591]MBD2093710.1 CHAT domain-containing protein [Trichocoleus sp. FACHB-591]